MVDGVCVWYVVDWDSTDVAALKIDRWIEVFEYGLGFFCVHHTQSGFCVVGKYRRTRYVEDAFVTVNTTSKGRTNGRVCQTDGEVV